MFETNKILQAAGGGGQDRIQIVRDGERVIFLLADGAGGRSGGAEASELATDLMSRGAWALASQKDCENLLTEIDLKILDDKVAGETTAVVVVVGPKGVFGARVGDSGAWILSETNIDDLSQNQIRKPCLGTGGASAVGFSRSALNGTLLVATDGLWKYTSRELIAGVIKERNLDDATAASVQLVRYPSGSLPDDVAIGLCRTI